MANDIKIALTISLLFLALGLFMLTGKGAMLVAGYNTMSKKKREQYNGKALSRFAGALLIAVSALNALGVAGQYYTLPWLSTGTTILIVVLVIAAILYINISKRFRNNTNN